MNMWFERPAWIWWLIPATAVMLFILYWSRRELQRRSVLINVLPRQRSYKRMMLGAAGAIALLLASAGPRWGAAVDVLTAHRGDIVFVLDASRSMLARDAMPDRLERGKEIINQLCQSLERRGGWRVGLVAFAGQSLILCPLTFDLDLVRQRAATISFDNLIEARPADAISGTRIGGGISTALQLFAASAPGDSPGANGLILISDGDDPVRDGEWTAGIEAALQQQIPVSVIAVGDPQRITTIPAIEAQSKMNEGVLREIAARTGGRYYSANGLDVESVVRSSANQADEHPGTLARSRAPARPTSFLVAGLLCLTLALLPWPNRRLVISSAALLIIAAHPTESWVWRGNQEMAAGRFEQALNWYQKAEERTPDPGLVAFNEGIALASLQRWRDAELHFRRSLSDAEGQRRWQSLYNLGTCLVRRSAGRDRQTLQDAIISFEQSLTLNNENPDVQQNLKIARDLLAQAPPDATPSNEDKNNREQIAKANNNSNTKAAVEKANSSSDKTGSNMNSKKGAGGQETDLPPPPGQGNLPMIPDSDVVESITPEDLKVHLDRAAARIAAAQRDQLKSRRPTNKPSYPDW